MKYILLLCAFISSLNVWVCAQDIYFVSSSYGLGDRTLGNGNNFFCVSRKDSNEIVVSRISKSSMLNDYGQRQKKNILFYIHGYGKSIEQVYDRSVAIEEAYNVHVVFLWWPSLMPNGRKATLKQAHSIIKNNILDFSTFLALQYDLKRVCPSVNYSLFAHSLGNYFFEVFPDQPFYNGPIADFSNIILNNAAVNDKNHSEWLSKLADHQDLYVISNKRDFILRGLQLFTSSKRPLGIRVKHKKLLQINYIDMTDVIGFRFPTHSTHSYFTGDILQKKQVVFDMYKAIINGERYFSE